MGRKARRLLPGPQDLLGRVVSTCSFSSCSCGCLPGLDSLISHFWSYGTDLTWTKARPLAPSCWLRSSSLWPSSSPHCFSADGTD